MHLHLGLGLAALGASAAAQAFSCAPTDNAECLLTLGKVTIVFDSGIYNFNGDSQFNGSDGHVVGYSAGAGDFPELSPLDNGLQASFSFVPLMFGQVGGSGFSGSHEATAWFAFDALRFVAQPGYRIDGITFSVSGYGSAVGNGNVALAVPGVPQFSGDQFVATAWLAPDSSSFSAGFSASATYEEGEDGGAAAYGTARAGFTAASLVVHVSAVPEPATWGLWLGGLAAATTRRRRTQPAR